jgi:hypothetical protein
MSMRQGNARNAVAIVAQITEIRDDEIYARQLLIGKHDTAIDDEDLLIVFIQHHVLADFTHSAQRNDFDFVSTHDTFLVLGNALLTICNKTHFIITTRFIVARRTHSKALLTIERVQRRPRPTR